MILTFSGTGNSRYAANKLSRILDEQVVKISEADPASLSFNGSSLGIVCPVYSWGIPPIVADFISKLNTRFLKDVTDLPVWGVLTCGDETGLAPEMLRTSLQSQGVELSGIWSVIMPNVYVLLPGFDVDSKDLEVKKLEEAKIRLRHIADKIRKAEWTTDCTVGKNAALKSKIIYPLFKKYGINTRKWRWTQECVMCGKCVAACPMNNITLRGGHPSWGKNCTSCLACYHTCPAHAIEYGRSTTRKGQYLCHLK